MDNQNYVNAVTEIDYLKLDTEGMDFKILKTIDYENFHKCIKEFFYLI